MIRSVDHINIVVSDLDRSIHFYQEVLGLSLFKRAKLQGGWIDKVVGLENVQAEVAYLRSPAGEPRIELLCYHSPQGCIIDLNSKANTLGLRHIAFQVEGIERCAEKLKSLDIKVLERPIEVPTAAVDHAQGRKSLFYFYDPDGVLLELAEYKPTS